MRADRHRLLSLGAARNCQRKLGEQCRLAAVSRPDVCARLARPAAKVNAMQAGDLYRINDLTKAAKA